jgi:hypothetical protein
VPASQAGPEFSLFEGAAPGLLDRDDLDAVAARLAPGATAAVLVYEELSILGVIEAWEPPVPESFPKAPSTSTSSTPDCREHDHEPASQRQLCRGRQLGARPYSAPPARSLGRRGAAVAAPPAAAPPPPVPPAPSPPVDDVIGQLERLGKLRTDA